MIDADKIKIQDIIIRWMGSQDKPIFHDRIKKVCNSITTNKEKGVLYNYFYPLVRAGIVEVSSSVKPAWQLAPPCAFFQDFNEKRRWIGINLTKDIKNCIKRSDIPKDEQSDQFDQLSAIVRWETNTEENGENLPVINNSPVLSLLRCFPICSPDNFAIKSPEININNYSQIYSQGMSWQAVVHGNHLVSGLYKLSEETYARRVYFKDGMPYSIRANPDDDFWAKAMHCIDNSIPIAKYDCKSLTLKFNIDPPFLVGRVLLLNQMFTQFKINSRSYCNITRQYLKELQRIFCNSITESGE